ncbi:MAG TPA: hypothetical protein VND62_03110 [Acidimicrobiales bacterium]|nr:hypothetical protein [Acidimicrobiales bacterium]
MPILVMWMAVAVLVVAGGVVYIVGNTSPVSSRAHLQRALLATTSAVTADVTMAVKISFDGLSVSVDATGSVDFATKAASLQMSVLGQTLSLVASDGVLYLKSGTLLSSQYPGKTWVRIPASSFAGADGNQPFVTYDPQETMSALVKLGATVSPIGTTSIDGTEDQGYQVHLTVADLEAHPSALPPSMQAMFATAKTVPKTAQVSATMYVDPAGRLQAEHVLVTGQENGHQVSASIDLTMSHFGTATVPGPPPATATVTYQQLNGATGSGLFPFSSPGSQVT